MSKDLIFSALRHEATPRAPWVPFAGVHAGSLTGAAADIVLKDGDTLFKALLEVNKLYKPDGQPVVFDLQLEAEILGCTLKWSDNCPPSVSSHPLADTMTVPCRCALPGPGDGRIPMVLDTMRRMKEAAGKDTALFGLVCGPFTLASHLRGNDLFTDMYDDPDYVKELLGFCAECAKRMSRYYTEAGMDVIAVVDPLVSQISSAHFADFLDEPCKGIFRHIRDLGALSAFFVCGDATRNIESMCQTAPDSIFVDENVDIAAAKAITDRHDIAMGGNIPLTTVMLHGTQQDNMKYVTDMISRIGANRNFIIAPGCDMPYGVPAENAIGAAQAALHPDETREMVKNYISARENIDVELPDYTRLDRPLVEVFTLDSQTCAACTYMMGAASAVKNAYGDRIDLAEYKFTQKENIARCVKMNVQKLPSICIDGKLYFSSIIPGKGELEAAVNAALAKYKE